MLLAACAGMPSLPPIDAAGLARRVVAAMHAAPGERAILVKDPCYYPELTEAFERELERAGVEPVVAIDFDPPDLVAPLAANRDEARRREDAFVALLTPAFQASQLFFWLPARAPAPGHRLERLVDGSSVRGVHFHWILPLEGKSPDELAALSRLYERVVLTTDSAALSREQDRLIAAIRGRRVDVTSAAGTRLRFQVPSTAWFHKNDGELSPERARQARGARDREMEFPAGALRLIPDAGSVEGPLVVPRLGSEAGAIEMARLEFAGGRIVRSSARSNEAALNALLARIGGDIDKVGEVVLGTNPLLVAPTASGELPYFGYGDGYLRISLGDNWESGGPLRTATGENLWLFLEGVTLEADGTTLVRDGRLVH